METIPEKEPCEFCGTPVTYGFSLCDECDDAETEFDEKTGHYILKDGEIVDTTTYQMSVEDSVIYNQLLPEVKRVYTNYLSDKHIIVELTEEDLEILTVRICEEREEDIIDLGINVSKSFPLSNKMVETKVYNGISNMIEKFMIEKIQKIID